jgi:methyl-accepting chemotaxis protein
MTGIARVKSASASGSDTIQRLDQSIGEIGTILTVIGDVAGRTRLLALNAAIIASQAGEHGKGFQVVADEIKALATRTATSTQEIAGVVQRIQTDARSAVSSMELGIKSVDEAASLGREATAVLGEIRRSAAEASGMVSQIADATGAQVVAARQVTTSLERVTTTVAKLNSLSHAQTEEAQRILAGTTQVRDFAARVRAVVDEQRAGAAQIAETITAVRNTTQQLEGAFDAQSRRSQHVLGLLENLRSVSQQNRTATGELGEAVTVLKGRLEALEAELSRFQT